MIIQTKTIIPSANNPCHRPSWRRCFLAVALSCFALLSVVHAVTPPPDGGYAGGNTAEGDDALFNLQTDESSRSGIDNTAVGVDALLSTTTGSSNTATGSFALSSNTIGSQNTASGSSALQSNSSGHANTATGFDALFFNTTGNVNTAVGASALFSNTTGNENTALGVAALNHVTTGSGNSGIGVNALLNTTTASFNTSFGDGSLYSNVTSPFNTGLGAFALFNNTGGNNIGIGYNGGDQLTTGSYNIDIGNRGVPPESNTIRIGTPGTHTTTFIAGITGATVTNNPSPVMIDASGQLGAGNPNAIPGPAGELIFLPAGAAAPAGFTLVASGDLSIKGHGKPVSIDVNVYRKN